MVVVVILFVFLLRVLALVLNVFILTRIVLVTHRVQKLIGFVASVFEVVIGVTEVFWAL